MADYTRYSDGTHPKVGIIGAGLSGIIMGNYLKEKLGIDDFVIFEGENDVGGTWKVNTYPGCGCDVNSHVYSMYNNLNPNWTKSFSGHREIQKYLANSVDKFNFKKNILFNCWVKECKFDLNKNQWKLIYKFKNSDEELVMMVDILVGANGPLRIPNIPEIFSSFKGTMMHSAKWDHIINLRGKKVGVVGSGASAVQIIPEIIDQVGELHLFQRTPPYVIPRRNYEYSQLTKYLFNYVPFLLTIYYWTLFLLGDMRIVAFYTGSWFAKIPTLQNGNYIRSQIRDPKKREAMVPKYHFGCKRVTPSDHYYQAIDRDHLFVHDGNIDRIEGSTLHLKDGTSQTVDVLILATGYNIQAKFSDVKITTIDNIQVDKLLDTAPRLQFGITATGLPNSFMLLGPTTGLGHNTITYMIECQANYVVRTLDKMMLHDIAKIDLKPEVGDAYWKWVQKRVKKMVFYGNCKNWYQRDNGEVIGIWPGTCIEYYIRTKNPKLEDYKCLPKFENFNYKKNK